MPQKDKLPKWKTTHSTYLVNDCWLKLRADTCMTPTGHEISPYYVLEYGDWVACLVLSDQGDVTVLRHYRHGIGEYVLEVVAAMAEDGEAPEAAVRRELEEELGLRNATIHPTGVCYANPATHTNKTYCFIALGGTFDGQRQDEPGADFEIVSMPFSDLTTIIENQTEVMQSLHLTSIFFALNFMKNHPR